MLLLRWLGAILLVITLILVSFANFSLPHIFSITLVCGITSLGILAWCEHYLYEHNRPSIFMEVLTDGLDILEMIFEIVGGIVEILGGLF